ncbi:MAG: hypothetical protein ACI9HE_002398 [Planctomycetota bacterium]|jgi:hypothetical protein
MDASSQSFPAGVQEQGKSVRGPLSRGQKLAVLCQVALASLMAWLVWAFDEWRAISLSYPEYFFWVVGSLLVVLLPLLAWRRRGAFLIPLAWCAYMGLLPLADTNALKPLLRGAAALTVDMDRSEIFATIHREFAGTPYDLPIIVSDSGDRILLRSRPDPGNSECVQIDLRAARFSRASFSPD